MSLPNEFLQQLYAIFVDPKAKIGAVSVAEMQDSVMAAILADPFRGQPLQALPGRLELAIAKGLVVHLEATFSPSRVEVRDACTELKAAIAAAEAVPCCRQCEAPLSADEQAANERTPIGSHDRAGRQLCDRCWAKVCESLCGPKGAEGVPGFSPPPKVPTGGYRPPGLHVEAASGRQKVRDARLEWIARHFDQGHTLTKHESHDSCSCGGFFDPAAAVPGFEPPSRVSSSSMIVLGEEPKQP